MGRLEENNFHDLCLGQVIVLQADPAVLAHRQLRRGNRTTPKEINNGSASKYLTRQRNKLDKIYERAIDRGSVVQTDIYPIAASVKAAARIVHLDKYEPFDFAERLREIQRGR